MFSKGVLVRNPVRAWRILEETCRLTPCSISISMLCAQQNLQISLIAAISSAPPAAAADGFAKVGEQ